MDAYWIHHFLLTITSQTEPDLINPHVDPETGELKWCQLMYGYDKGRLDKMIRIYIYAGSDQILDGDTWNISVPLDKIVITGARGSSNPPAIGTGGTYYLSFNKDANQVEGIETAFRAALNAAKAEANT